MVCTLSIIRISAEMIIGDLKGAGYRSTMVDGAICRHVSCHAYFMSLMYIL